MAAIRGMLQRDDVRLLTLVGPGGIGKTRLALQAAGGVADAFVHGVCNVDLTPISDPARVIPAIVRALGMQETAGQPLIESVKAYLRGKQMLLLLDNFEHVLPAAPDVSELLARCPRLKMLVTSRTSLRLGGEHEFSVAPLPSPDAVALFVRTAVRGKTDFVLTDANAPVVVEICARLDGLPLAIELAAVRIKLLPPQVLLARLEERLGLLTSGSLDAPARHQTLRGCIRWSYELLDEREKAFFRRLSIFVGGFTLEAAEAVCDARLDLLASLVDQHMMQPREGEDDEPRFGMLETIREYGQERLVDCGDGENVRRRHAEYFLALAERADAEIRSPRRIEWLRRLDQEYGNLLAALTSCLEPYKRTPENGLPAIGLRLAGAMAHFWDCRGRWSEGRGWLEAALAHTDPADRTGARAKALHGLGYLSWGHGDEQAPRLALEEAVAIRRKLGEKRELADSLAELFWFVPDIETQLALLDESIALAREIGDRWRLAASLIYLGNVPMRRHAPDEAEPFFEEALAIAREIGARELISGALNCLGHAATERGDYAAARSLEEQSLVLARESASSISLAFSLRGVAFAAFHQGDAEVARPLYEESLKLLRQIGTHLPTVHYLDELAAVVRRLGDNEAARACYEERLAIYREMGEQQGIDDSLEKLAALPVG